MTRIPTFLLLSIVVLGAASTACRQGEPTEPAPAPDASASTDNPANSDEGGVTYEPAYPAEVSDEDLKDDDVAQQEATHSHGGDEHSHGDGSHSHDEGEPHDEDDHDH